MIEDKFEKYWKMRQGYFWKKIGNSFKNHLIPYLKLSQIILFKNIVLDLPAKKQRSKENETQVTNEISDKLKGEQGHFWSILCLKLSWISWNYLMGNHKILITSRFWGVITNSLV